MQKLIITAAINGAEVTKEQQPGLPITPDEIAQVAVECEKAGASIIHLHGRDIKGRPTQDKEVFRSYIESIKSKSNIIIQTSTGGAVGMTPEERLQPVSLKPEMATLTTGTANFGDEVFYNPPKDIEKFASYMQEMGVKPEIEVFDVGMINNALMLVKKGLLSLPLHFDLVMGVPGAIPGTPKNLIHLVETLPVGSTWTVAGIGRMELPLGVMAVLLGGHVRVGFEDNIFYTKGVLAKSNAQLVERIVRVAGELGREIATPDEARGLLGISRPCSIKKPS
ncbi:MAG: 3-keto-5-aminohexanoate cleavage protein [Desulfitibacter sp. BRH_c19]|nr:MAG: 3-keto-5-aminohexanoate cleavage protein [Desulfitibacter sp. BRH_c19]